MTALFTLVAWCLLFVLCWLLALLAPLLWLPARGLGARPKGCAAMAS